MDTDYPLSFAFSLVAKVRLGGEIHSRHTCLAPVGSAVLTLTPLLLSTEMDLTVLAPVSVSPVVCGGVTGQVQPRDHFKIRSCYQSSLGELFRICGGLHE